MLINKFRIYIITIVACSLTGILFLYFIDQRINYLQKEKAQLMTELSEMHTLIEDLTGKLSGVEFLDENNIPQVIDNITNIGAELNVYFVSFKPDNKKIEDPKFNKKQFNIEVESGYKNLGMFIGLIHEIWEGKVAVKDIEILRDPEILPLVKTKLTLELFLSFNDYD